MLATYLGTAISRAISSMLRHWVACIALGAAIVVDAAAASAMGVTPVTLELEASGRRSSGQIVVSNTENRKLPVELNVSLLTLRPDGKVQRSTAADQFVIYPPQAAIGPSSNQTFRIQFIGDPGLLESEAFEISVDQIPVDLSNENTGGPTVQIVYSIGAVVVVAPVSGVASVSVEKTELFTDAKGILHPRAYFHNEGARHAFLDEGRLIIAAVDKDGKIIWDRTLGSEEIRQQIGIGYLPPHFTRAMDLPIDLPPESASLKIIFKQKSG